MKKLILGSLVALILGGCYPKGPEYISDLDLVVTNFDDEFDFEEQVNYFLIDTVIHIVEDGSDIDRTYDRQILDLVEFNMNSRGFERVNTVQESDIALAVSAWSSTTVNFVYDWWGYWGPWYPGYGPGWGWGYPGYGWTYAYSYTTGTISIEMSYPEGANQEEMTIPVVWHGYVNGLIAGSQGSIADRIDLNINQAFEQSPYLISNPE